MTRNSWLGFASLHILANYYSHLSGALGIQRKVQVIFKFTNTLIATLLLLSAISHIVLLASDNPQYRLFVYVQIATQVVCSFLLVGIQKFKLSALIGFVLLSLVFFLINSTYINHGNFVNHLFVYITFWCVYGAILYRFKINFSAKYA